MRKRLPIKKHIKKPRAKIRKKIKYGVLFLVIILGLVLISQILQAIISSDWEAKNQITLAMASQDKVYFVKMDKGFKEVLIYEFEENMILEMAEGYGEYEINKARKLALQENKKLGEMLSSSMSFYFGVITDGYIDIESEEGLNFKKNIILALLGKAESNFSKWDLMRMYLFLINLRIEDVQYYKLANLGFYNKEVRVDGKEVWLLDKNKFDNYVLSYIADLSFLEEKFCVEVFNSTNYAGLASILGRVINNSGLCLRGLRQTKNSYEESFMIISDEYFNNKSVDVLARYFNFKKVKKSEFQDTGEGFGDRVEVVVVLGEDFLEKYF